MTRSVLNWLFDLGSIPKDASGLELAWARPMPGWIWFIAIVVAVALAVWSYARLQGPGWARGLLAAARTFIILLVIALIAGPQIRFPREQIEQDVVLVLVDRSSSMAIKDATDVDGRVTREEQLHQLLEESESTWRSIDERSELRWMGFSAGVFPLDRALQPNGIEPDEGETAQEVRGVLPQLDEPMGWRTDISTSIRQALDGVAARPLSGIVVFSDGRSSARPGRAVLRRLQQAAVPVFVVPLGSPDPVQDVAIGDVSAPRRAFVRDSIPVLVNVESSGYSEGEPVVVRLRDLESGEIVDRKTIEMSDGADEILLNANLEEPGEYSLVVEVESAGGDLIAENDQQELEVEIVERPIRVLYIEGYPRWEYRYLKNLLVREESIESSVMLISADRDFAQEGNTPITRIPRTEEELEQFDLIMIGDVPAGFFSPEQLRLMKNQVAERGSGLIWIGGPRSTPSSWAGTPLDDLLPIRSPLELERATDGVMVEPAPLSRRLGVLMLDPAAPNGWAAEISDPSTGWSKLHSVQRLEPAQVKPTAEVLAIGTDGSGEARPVLLSMRFGAGQVLYAAMDDVWRWRFGRGELLTERWWIGLLRMLARQALDASGRSLVLDVEPDQLVPGAAGRIVLTIVDERLAGAVGEEIALEIRDEDGRASVELELVNSGDSAEWSADWFPDRVGRYRLHVVDPILMAEARASGTPLVEVVRPDDEFRNPDTDHQLLGGLADTSGGAVLGRKSLESLPTALPNREVLVENPIVVPIWNTGTMFFLLLALLASEWIGRRLLRMI